MAALGTRNIILMQSARNSLNGRWALAIGTFLIYGLILSAAGSMRFSGALISLFISGPFMLGAAIFSLNMARGRYAGIEQLFQGFDNFVTALGAYLLIVVFVILWSLLLIIPGIVAALSYAMTFYILVDEPEIKADRALEKSKRLMYGYKWKLFFLCLRFFLLALLCVLTLGIGFLWLFPFMNVTMAKFYDDLKGMEAPIS